MSEPWVSRAKFNQTLEEKKRYDDNYDRIFRKKRRRIFRKK